MVLCHSTGQQHAQPTLLLPPRIITPRDTPLPQVMCCDFGFRTGSARLYQEQYGEVPGNIFQIVSLPARLLPCMPARLAAPHCVTGATWSRAATGICAMDMHALHRARLQVPRSHMYAAHARLHGPTVHAASLPAGLGQLQG